MWLRVYPGIIGVYVVHCAQQDCVLLCTVRYTHTNKEWINMQPHDGTDLITACFNWLLNNYNFSKARMVAPWWWSLNRNM